MQEQLKVIVLSHTPEPEKIISAAAKLCYSKSGIDHILKDLTEDKINQFTYRTCKLYFWYRRGFEKFDSSISQTSIS